MRRFDIPKDLLKNLYISQGLTTYQIAEKLGFCQGTIWKRLRECGIKTRFPWNGVDLTKKQLKNWYLSQGLFTWKIEKRFGYSRGTVHRKLREFGIQPRDIAESHITYARKDFSEDILEKACLIGFRIGDLNVTKCGPQSKTIAVKCGSTQLGQISLFKKLFAHYGHIIEGKPTKNLRINIQANLNLSFSFLLDKNNYDWVFKKQDTFFAFLAGFSDAEGSFMITQNGQANFAIGNYDHNLLNKIKHNLDKFGIETPKISVYKGKGLLASNGYKNNGDYSTLHCSRKKYLLKLLNYLKPYLKHPDKVRKIKLLEQNVALRNKLYGNIKMA